MAVLRDDAVGFELDDRERAVASVDGACDHAVPDRDRTHRVEVIEG
jgi:hypothetical protein